MHLSPSNTIAVIGLGYVGLPTALAFAQAGYHVLGYDKNAALVEALNKGETDINEAGISELLKSSLASGRFSAHANLQKANAYFICVPTPVEHASKAPDLGAVFSAVGAIEKLLKPSDLVVLESTSPVGTTRDIFKRLSAPLKTGRIYAAYCPERILPGKVLEELSTLDRVIGGVDDASAHMAKSFFTRLTKGQCFETTAETAEFVKLAENSFRDVNIAFANELKNLCDRHNVDVEKVRHFANMHPRVDILQSGIGVGGHCIPVDPWFLVHASQAGEPSVIRSAREVNDGRPVRVAQQIIDAAKQQNAKTINVYGLTYKANVNDFRESPALDIVKHLAAARNFIINVYDPFLKGDEAVADFYGATPKTMNDVANADMQVFLVAHDAFKPLCAQFVKAGQPVLDFCTAGACMAVAEASEPQEKLLALA